MRDFVARAVGFRGQADDRDRARVLQQLADGVGLGADVVRVHEVSLEKTARHRLAAARYGGKGPVRLRPLPEFGKRCAGEGVGRILAEKAQRGQQRSLRRVLVDGAREGLLGELFAGGVGGERQVGVGRHRLAEQAEEVDLARGRVEQVGTAHHMGDARIGVVDHHGELIGEETVGALDHVVARIVGEVDLLRALHCVIEADRAFGAHPPGPPLATRRQAVAAGAGVAARAVAGQGLIGELAPGAGAGVGVAGGLERIQRCLIGCGAPALPDHLAIPFEAEACQRGEDACGGAGDCARGVDILDAQQPASAVGARFKKAADRGDQRAEVQRAGRRGREAADIKRIGGA